MADLAPFPDIEAAVIELLTDLGTADVQTPSDLAGNLPFIRVRSLGGSGDRWNDKPHVDIDVFAVKRTDARTTAELARQRLLSFPHTLSHCVIDTVDVANSPQEVPWANTDIRLIAASYTVTARRTA